MKVLIKLLDFISEVISLYVILMLGSITVSFGLLLTKWGLSVFILAIVIAGGMRIYDKYIKKEVN